MIDEKEAPKGFKAVEYEPKEGVEPCHGCSFYYCGTCSTLHQCHADMRTDKTTVIFVEAKC